MAESEEYLRDFPRQLAEDMVAQLRVKLNLSEDTCYLTAFIAAVDGMPKENVVQVCPGGATPWGDGEGGQEGGTLLRDQQYLVGIFFNTNFDPHQMTEETLIELSRGVLDYSEKIRSMLNGAFFGAGNELLRSQQVTQMRYVGESNIQVVDGDAVQLMKQFTFAQPYAMPLVDDRLTIGYS
jgi:hypothetical protein